MKFLFFFSSGGTMRSTYLSLNVHIIFSTKRREPRILPAWQPRLFRYLGGAIKGQKAQPLAIGVVDDHLHLLVGFRATHCLADFMRELKRQSSIWVHETIGDLQFNWQEGYSAFTVSPSNINGVKKYIANQAAHHHKVTYLSELRRLLSIARIEFDPHDFI